ncbi:Ger(x)C family spore germination protein [Bacillus sp. RAR_GA_16]|uniref:Ger(x)C family spore germination protein n=1 Tax=Bacillus sp. RAR_GA_16 TaxID=2876774 RepID=UPI001CC954F9|nr:Ger(x)C family spore germination protein [Bacillus sp. RAR_GA_16]MCA0172587.1 Ger(x)C family spore germination protein [Bacillus sp. RAR_GA_16]
MRKYFLIFMTVQLLFLTSCWDSNEIEDLGMIMGIGLDYNDSEEDIFSMTNQYVVPNNIQGTQTGSASGTPYQNLTLNGNNFFQIIRENSLETDRPPNYTHLKSMVLSERLLEEEPLKQLISFFLRDHEFRRTVAIFISKEAPADILEVEPTKEMFPGVQLKELTQNHDRSLYVLDTLKFGEVSKKITEGASFVIPEVGINKGRLRLLGAGIVSNKNEHVVGWLTPEEIGGLKWITDEVNGGLVAIEEKNAKEDQAVLEIMKANTNLEPVIKDGKLSMKLTVNSSLRLAEDWEIKRDVFQEGWEQELKTAGENKVKKDIEHVISVAQEQGLDFLEFGTWVSIKQPTYWKQHEKEWDEIFSNLPVIIDVNFTITGYGTQDIN